MNLNDFYIAKGTPLEYKKYEKYYIGGNAPGQWVFKFKNDYGASVIKHFGSYGYEKDLFELAVIFFVDDNKWELSYNTPITNDVIGWLTNEEVLKKLGEIKKLK